MMKRDPLFPSRWRLSRFARHSSRCCLLPGRETGQSIAEVALITPLVLLLLVGTIEIGRLAYYSIEVANAARAGVQYGAQNLADSKDSSGIQTAAQVDASDVTDLDVNSVRHCACSDTPAEFVGCPLSPSRCSSGHPVVFLEVDTTGSFRSLFHYPGLPQSLSLNGQAIMRVAAQ